MNNLNFSKTLKYHREKSNISKSELSRIIGVSPSYITKLENGEKTNPSLELRIKLAAALNLDVSEFLTEEQKQQESFQQLNKKLTDLNSDMDKLNGTLKLNTTNHIDCTIPFDEMKSKVNKLFPALQPEIDFLSNPNIEMVFDYSFNELAKKGFDELLIVAIENAIRKTLKDIDTHLTNGDLFDGVSSWISKDSPLYEIIKKHREEKK